MNNLLFPIKKERVSYSESLKICHKIAKDNYENFPVLMFFIGKEKMNDFLSLYAFSRGVDFIGDDSNGNKELELNIWEKELKKAFENKATLPTFIALQKTIKKHNLEINPFLRLIKANKIDQEKKEYKNIKELLEYCEFSANPVGEIVLAILGYKDKKLVKLSNNICSGLQITNFLQDIIKDKKIGRVYMPIEIMTKNNISKDIFENKFEFDEISKRKFNRFLDEMIIINKNLYNSGKCLPRLLRKKDAILIQIFLDSGEKVLKKIKTYSYKSLHNKPKTNRLDKIYIIINSIIKTFLLK
ncbi:MAG: hypothetical protein CL761_06215 [Chloroflexi bacterium]|nr:hypothetical protein [Chloroflexota bacterium]|tara:strand:+ start:42397 stop:43296 length:900 start_codon:yes stop_codon:yes gene_type:complete